MKTESVICYGLSRCVTSGATVGRENGSHRPLLSRTTASVSTFSCSWFWPGFWEHIHWKTQTEHVTYEKQNFILSHKNFHYEAFCWCPHAHFVCCLMLLPPSGWVTAGFFPGRRWAWPSLLPLLLFAFLKSPLSSWATGGVTWHLTDFCDVEAVSLSLDFLA